MLTVKNLCFSYPDSPTKALSDFGFDMQAGEIISVLGASGSGKSTLLRCIYGLEDLEEGEVVFLNNVVKGPAYQLIPGHKDMKYVAQDFDLMPFTTVAENVGKFLSNIDKTAKQQRVEQVLDAVGMLEFIDQFPRFLSGGQKQRVAIAQALAKQPKLLLLDEPFSNLDFRLKRGLAERLFSWAKRNEVAVIYTSHDSSESLAFSDKILIIEQGICLQYEQTQTLYWQPKSVYVAKMLGPINVFTPEEAEQFFGLKGDGTNLLVHPHELEVSDQGKIEVRVKSQLFLGGRYGIHALVKGKKIFFYSNTAYAKDTKLRLAIKRSHWTD